MGQVYRPLQAVRLKTAKMALLDFLDNNVLTLWQQHGGDPSLFQRVSAPLHKAKLHKETVFPVGCGGTRPSSAEPTPQPEQTANADRVPRLVDGLKTRRAEAVRAAD